MNDPVSLTQRRSERVEGKPKKRVYLRTVGLADALDKHFGDSEWHDLEDAVEKLGHIIPAEIAHRRVMHSLRQNKKPVAESMDDMVRRGRRWLIAKAISDAGGEPGGPGIREKWRSFRLAPGKAGRNHGGRHPNAKHTDEEVRALLLTWYQGGTTQQDLALKYGLSRQWMSALVTGRVWTHLDHEDIKRQVREERGQDRQGGRGGRRTTSG